MDNILLFLCLAFTNNVQTSYTQIYIDIYIEIDERVLNDVKNQLCFEVCLHHIYYITYRTYGPDRQELIILKKIGK